MSHRAKLLLRDEGTTLGTIGGGALEHEVLRVARELLAETVAHRSSRPLARLLEFDLGASEAATLGMICGGRCAILIEAITPERDPAAFTAAAAAEASGSPIALLTVLQPARPDDGLGGDEASPAEGSRLGLYHAGKLVLSASGEMISAAPLRLPEGGEAALREAALEALAEGRPRYLHDPVRVHIDPLLPQPRVLIFGGGHIGLCLAHMAGIVGFRVMVVDDRAEFANRERFPAAEEVLVARPAEAMGRLGVDGDSYVVAVTRGHALDEEVVAEALRTPARYIGMIGSRRKVAEVLARLKARGFSDRELSRIHAPIGLDLGAETVEEIAVSILAELIAVRRSTGPG
jgi:xanthine dehydrogenase accessory factor